MESVKDGVLEARSLKGGGHGGNVTEWTVARCLRGQVRERKVVTDVYSCFSESVNRWCTNAMLARSNARDSVRNTKLTIANAVRRASWRHRSPHVERRSSEAGNLGAIQRV